VKNVYLDILDILQSEYGVSEEKAKELSLIMDSVSYTKELKRILGEEVMDFPDEEEEAEAEEEEERREDVEAEPSFAPQEYEVDVPGEEEPVLPEADGLTEGEQNGQQLEDDSTYEESVDTESEGNIQDTENIPEE